MPTKPEALFDKRTVERNIKRGRVTQKEYDAYLKTLNNAEDKATALFPEEEGEAEQPKS